jgi:DNA-3-methyladenine glycosylase II
MRTMTDHPAWESTDGCWRRLFVADDGRSWLVVLPDAAEDHGRLRTYRLPPSAGVAAPELVAALAGMSPVVRHATASLWDALVTAIIRQVVRAGHATMLYRAFCATYGADYRHGGETIGAVPSAAVVAALTDEDFARVGLAFKRHTLRAAARAYQDHGTAWQALTPMDLVARVQSVPRIGPWTAGAAVADWTNDFALYPYGDLAVRTWARRAAPTYPWPDDEAAFGREWRRIAGAHLGTLTALTLALGRSHDPTDP